MTSSTIDPEDIGILLEDGAKSVGQLAGWLKQPVPAVLAVLTRMGRAGQVERVGPQRLWALNRSQVSRPAVPTAASTVGAAAPADRSRPSGPRRTHEPADSDGPAFDGDEEDGELPDDVEALTAQRDELSALMDSEASDEFLDLVDSPRRRGRPAKALRQPRMAERAPGAVGKSWWEGLSRSEHQAEGARRSDEMSRTREGRSVPGLPR